MVASTPDYVGAKAAILEIVKEKECHPIFVRLAWHDAGTYDKETKTGGPRGVMRFTTGTAVHGANNGLGIARGLLEPVKEKFPSITYADLWALAGATGIEHALRRAGNNAQVKWRAGRVDAPESEVTPDGRLPDALQGASHLRDIFHRMGLSDKDIVALSGAHTLGRLHPDRSGFEGPWVKDPLAFDNSYFVDLLKDTWEEGVSSTGQKQYWNKAKGTAMLVSDLTLLTDPVFRPLVEKYASDNDAFVSEFVESFQALLELSYSEGELVEVPGLF